MSFGAKGIELFSYATPGNGVETFEDAMIGRDGEKTVRYEYVKKIIGEMNRFTGHYVPYQWEGAMTNRNGLSTEERVIDVVFPAFSRKVRLEGTYLDLDHPLEHFDPVESFEGEYPLLMGCFTQGEKRAFTLVNMEDPGRKRANRACVNFDGPKTLMVHGKDGSRQVETGAKWEVELESGDGFFVEVL